MAKRKATENVSSDAAANRESAAEQAQPTNDLPVVESPPISPATPDVAVVPETSPEPAAASESDASVIAASGDETAPAAVPEIATTAPANSRRLILRPRHKRYALLAASVALAAAFGAVVGAAATGGFSRSAAVDAATIEENKARQQSIARLAEEVTSLKASFEAAKKSAHSQIAKLSEHLNRESAEITGSIKPPQTMAASAAPLPTPRPATSPAETRSPRLSILADWSIRDTRGGYVYVQGHGDVYQVVPGAPLPGLGPVEQIKRQDGRWVVVTPKGIIVAARDRRYFEQF